MTNLSMTTYAECKLQGNGVDIKSYTLRHNALIRASLSINKKKIVLDMSLY
eukprot:gene39619-48325_t